MKKSFLYLIVLATFVISRGLNLFVRRAQRFSASGMTSQTWRQTSSYLERPYTARKNAVERFCGDRRPLSGGGDNADTWRAALTIESPTESFPRRMISFPWRLEALREAAYVPKVCIEAINARVKPVSRSSAILRYATFLGTPQRTSSLHSLSLSLSARFFHRYSWHKTLPRLRPFLAVVGN